MTSHKSSSCSCSPRWSLVLAGLVFSFLALVHLYRIFYFFPVILGSTVVTSTASIVALVVLAILAIIMFWSAAKAK